MDDERPWERASQMRRDGDPHRGDLGKMRTGLIDSPGRDGTQEAADRARCEILLGLVGVLVYGWLLLLRLLS